MLTKAHWGMYPLDIIVTKARKSLQSFSAENRLIQVPRKYTWVKAGMVIQSKAHGEFLLGQHHTSVQYFGFYGLTINAHVEAVETLVVKHPVTGMAGHRIEQAPIVIPMVEYNTGIDDVFGLPSGRTFLISGMVVNRNWKLDGYRIANIHPKVGLTFIEVEDDFG